MFPGLIDAGLLGSSPLTRGKPHSVPELPIRRRLIPAHAGKTAISSLYSAGLAAHPRSRGENSGGEGGHSIGFGSSPLTRGKPSIVRNPACRAGLIPAHAGKTPAPQADGNQEQAHPRSRGENRAGARNPVMETGSSPLTRGKQGGYRVNGRGLRLIPAHAGKTCATSTGNSHAPAHPRSRGENMVSLVSGRAFSGSSPLTRGKRFSVGAGLRIVRLIPAHAGKTTRRSSPGPPEAAHPRSRGENVLRDLLVNQAQGSSPLTRGKRDAAECVGEWARLIPAHAGKTSMPVTSRPPERAHPRSRGENSAFLTPHWKFVGSSPLTRGKQGVILDNEGM